MACFVVMVLAVSSGAAQQADPACGNPLVNAFGPYDYRIEKGPNRRIVEDYHFTPNVESLISGQSASIGSDIDYTLRAFPNHHRALTSMMNLGARAKTPKPPGAQYSVECYFKRALLFRSDDTIARMLYAKYLADTGRKSEAIQELDATRAKAMDNAFTHYNIGLLYFEFGEFDKALVQAHQAINYGFERSELKTRLQSVNKWTEPPPEDPAGAAGSQPAASEPAR